MSTDAINAGLESIELEPAMADIDPLLDLQRRIGSDGVVCKDDAITMVQMGCELPRQAPLASFTEDPSPTNVTAAMESIFSNAKSWIMELWKKLLRMVQSAVNWVRNLLRLPEVKFIESADALNFSEIIKRRHAVPNFIAWITARYPYMNLSSQQGSQLRRHLTAVEALVGDAADSGTELGGTIDFVAKNENRINAFVTMSNSAVGGYAAAAAAMNQALTANGKNGNVVDLLAALKTTVEEMPWQSAVLIDELDRELSGDSKSSTTQVDGDTDFDKLVSTFVKVNTVFNSTKESPIDELEQMARRLSNFRIQLNPDQASEARQSIVEIQRLVALIVRQRLMLIRLRTKLGRAVNRLGRDLALQTREIRDICKLIQMNATGDDAGEVTNWIDWCTSTEKIFKHSW